MRLNLLEGMMLETGEVSIQECTHHLGIALEGVQEEVEESQDKFPRRLSFLCYKLTWTDMSPPDYMVLGSRCMSQMLLVNYQVAYQIKQR